MRLIDIEVREVSLVNKAANGAKFAILKRDFNVEKVEPAVPFYETPEGLALLKSLQSAVEKLKIVNSQ